MGAFLVIKIPYICIEAATIVCTDVAELGGVTQNVKKEVCRWKAMVEEGMGINNDSCRSHH